MGAMNAGGSIRRRGQDSWRRAEQSVRQAAAAPQAPSITCLVLGLASILQAVTQQVPRLTSGGDGLPGPVIVLVLLAAASTLPIGFLWSQPRVMAAVVAIALVLSVGLADAITAGGFVAVIICLYRLGDRGAQLPAAVICLVFVVLALAKAAGRDSGLMAVLLAGGAPLAAWAGYARRASDEEAARTAEHAAIAGTLLEHTARGERARISRELHDVVAHHISMIAVQAETARLTTPGMPAAGAQRLSAIGDTARSALTEMRRLLGVLREDTGDEPAKRQPQPGLSGLNILLDDARDATGAGTRLIISGWQTALDPGVELAAYRIIQEALTNARRHAPGAAVDVELRYSGTELYLRIRDNGPGPPGADAGGPGGHGLAGMRERAAAVGGRLRTGLATGGGFQVEAWLPATADEAVA
jgi:signal transduction histidine kinase